MSNPTATFLRSEAGCQLSLHPRAEAATAAALAQKTRPAPVMTLVVSPAIRSLLPTRIARVERCIARTTEAVNMNAVIPEGRMIAWSSSLDWPAAEALAKRVERHLFQPLTPKRVVAICGISLSELKDLPTSASQKCLGERYGKRYSYNLYSLDDFLNVTVFLGRIPLFDHHPTDHSGHQNAGR